MHALTGVFLLTVELVVVWETSFDDVYFYKTKQLVFHNYLANFTFHNYKAHCLLMTVANFI